MECKRQIIFMLGFIYFTQLVCASSVSFYFDTSYENDSVLVKSDLVRSKEVMLVITSDKESECRYSAEKNVSFDYMLRFDQTLGNIHKKSFSVIDGIYKNYIKCKDSNGNISKELQSTFTVSLPPRAQIIIDQEEPINTNKVKVEVTTTKIVETPSLSYSFDGISFKPIPLMGSKSIWEGYFIIPYDIKEGVVSFKFQARDLEGVIGTDIDDGNSFLIDYVSPKQVLDINAIGEDDGIKVNWYTEEDDVSSFNLYKSTSQGVSYSDFYRTVDGKSTTDFDVSKGKTYYYKVAALDSAGNEGPLSREVYATALLGNVSLSLNNGLELRLVGFVDNMLSNIDRVESSLEENKLNIENNEFYRDLNIDKDFDSVSKEIISLRKEVENYKNQPLSKEELDKKLNSADLKINIINKKIAESITVIDEKQIDNKINENDVLSVLLEIRPSLEDNSKIGSKSFEASKNLRVKTKGYNIEVTYMDGSRKRFTLVVKDISLEEKENITIINVISKEIVDSTNKMYIKNTDYEILEEDPIISFPPNTNKITYFLSESIDLSLLEKDKVMVIKEIEEVTKNRITGYFVFDDNNSGQYLGALVGILILVSMGFYLYKIKRSNDKRDTLRVINDKINSIKVKLDKNDVVGASQEYKELSNEYKLLAGEYKKLVFADIDNLYVKINKMSVKNEN